MAWLNFQIFCRNKNRGLAPRHSLLTAFAVGAMAAFPSLLHVPRFRAGDTLGHGFCGKRCIGLTPSKLIHTRPCGRGNGRFFPPCWTSLAFGRGFFRGG